jgi:hypothetical protein
MSLATFDLPKNQARKLFVSIAGEKMPEFIRHCGARAVPVRLLSGGDGKLP